MKSKIEEYCVSKGLTTEDFLFVGRYRYDFHKENFPGQKFAPFAKQLIELYRAEMAAREQKKYESDWTNLTVEELRFKTTKRIPCPICQEAMTNGDCCHKCMQLVAMGYKKALRVVKFMELTGWDCGKIGYMMDFDKQ